MSGERPIHVLDVNARPAPIRTPGRVKVSALVNVTAELPSGLSADVVVSKSVLGIHLKIPCYRNIGSWYASLYLHVVNIVFERVILCGGVTHFLTIKKTLNSQSSFTSAT